MAVQNVIDNLSYHGPSGAKYSFRQRLRTVSVPGRGPKAYQLVDRRFLTYTAKTGAPGSYFDVHAGYNNSGDEDAMYNSMYANSITASSNLNDVKLAYSRAYAKVRDRLGDQSELLTALAERSSTYKTVNNRSLQLLSGLVHLRKGRFKQFLDTFGIMPKRAHRGKLRNRAADAGGLWLEYWFGWSPLVSDINNAFDVWDRPLPDISVSESSGFSISQSGSWSGSYGNRGTYERSGFGVIKVGTKISVTNPDLFLANQMGLANPLLTGVQLVPWSWLVNWFVNIEQVVGSLSDWVGLDTNDTYVTRFSVQNLSQDRQSGNPMTTGQTFTRRTVTMRREVFNKIPLPSLTYRIPNVSWTRTATISSLIVQNFRTVEKSSNINLKAIRPR